MHTQGIGSLAMGLVEGGGGRVVKAKAKNVKGGMELNCNFQKGGG